MKDKIGTTLSVLLESTIRTAFTNFSICILVSLFCNGCAEWNSRKTTETRFNFVQITDTHFGVANHYERTRIAVEGINALPVPIKCVVHTGDITQNNILKDKIVDEGLAILSKLKVPIHYVAGNHDILAQKLESTREAYVAKFGGLITQAEYDGVVFIFVYTEPLRKSFTIKGYHPLEELENILREAGCKPVLVFHHAPSADDFYNNKFHNTWKLEIRRKWVDLLNSYNVKAVIAGHFHRDELHWLGRVPLYVSSSIAGYWHRQALFRIYEYRDGKIGYSTQYITVKKQAL